MLVYNVLHPLATLWEIGVKYAGVTGGMYKTHGAVGAVLQGALKRAADVAAFPKQMALLYTSESDPAVETVDLSPLSLVVLGIHAAAVAAAVWMRGREGDRPSGRTLTLWMLAATVITGFFRARYLMPCVIFFAALAGRGLAGRRTPLLAAALAVILFYNARQIWTDFGTDESAPYRDLVAALRANDLRYGYTGYDIAYPVAFLSEETIILSPKAGPISFDRLPHYTDKVRTQARICYIFEDGSEIDARFRALLSDLGVTCERLRAGRFAIYHGLPPDAVRAIPLPVGAVAER
ncbi:MAG: hypothetical protein EXS64_13295 [Candidatus Latescibacteria bacterium]|nr:hypothetical protein [Candidatus Latescibacterota bacterium]